MERIVDVLRASLGAGAVVTGDEIGPRYKTDWTQIRRDGPAAVVLPRAPEQVATVLRICHDAGQPVVPQGGMTGLAGGAVPAVHEICISMERLTGVEEIDASAASMTVLAGTTLQTVQEAAAAAGFEFAVDMGSRGSCQIGGVLATNAGGIRVIQSGNARENVLGLEAILADGTMLSAMNKMIKNNAGYDWKHWFIGSEGTLGIITRAVLRLRPRPAARHTALCALGSYDAAMELLLALRMAFGSEVGAFEIMWPEFFDFGVAMLRAKNSPFPRGYPLYALVETTAFDPRDTGERTIETLSDLMQAGTIADAVIASSAAETKALWEIREATAHFAARLDPLNLDISIPAGAIGRFAKECQELLLSRWPGHRCLFFGHAGDSNLHVTLDRRAVTGTPDDEIEQMVYGLVAQYQGSISAEHGIGLLKRDYLHYSRSAAEVMAMRALKRALDPKGILNPGKVLPAPGASAHMSVGTADS